MKPYYFHTEMVSNRFVIEDRDGNIVAYIDLPDDKESREKAKGQVCDLVYAANKSAD